MDSDSRMALPNGNANPVAADRSLVPEGWRLVRSGPLYANDKIWSPEKLAWLLVTVNNGFRAEDFPAAIRKDGYA